MRPCVRTPSQRSKTYKAPNLAVSGNSSEDSLKGLDKPEAGKGEWTWREASRLVGGIFPPLPPGLGPSHHGRLQLTPRDTRGLSPTRVSCVYSPPGARCGRSSQALKLECVPGSLRALLKCRFWVGRSGVKPEIAHFL